MEIRRLTRKEQLEWLIPFLEEQLNTIQQEIQTAKEEYKAILKNEEKQFESETTRGKKLLLNKRTKMTI